jgi:putative phosphoribosyl transferase
MTGKKEIEIKLGNIILGAILYMPENPAGLVIFAHGSGSGRFSPRNNFVAEQLAEKGIASLLADLLSPEEETLRRNVFDIELLTSRLVAIASWAKNDPVLGKLNLAYFGASTGAAAALAAAAKEPEKIMSVVSRGGRPDLAGDYLEIVKAPTLLIVGGEDKQVIALNEEALDKIKAPKSLIIIPGAGHLFEESGTLEKVADLAAGWFIKNFAI